MSRRRVTVRAGSPAARRTSASPCRGPRPTTGSAMPPSPGAAGKLPRPSTSHRATAAAPASAARAAVVGIVPAPRARTTSAPVTREVPSGVRKASGAPPVAMPASSRSTTTGSLAADGSAPIRGSGPRRASAGPRWTSRAAVRGVAGAERPPTAITVGPDAGPPTAPGRENVGPSLPAGATTVAPIRSAAARASDTGSMPPPAKPSARPSRMTSAPSAVSPSPSGSTARSRAASTRSVRASGRSRPPTGSGATTR